MIAEVLSEARAHPWRTLLDAAALVLLVALACVAGVVAWAVLS